MNVDEISIAQLSNLFKQYEKDIIEGRYKLSLTASLLQKINYVLQEVEYDNVSSSNATSKPEEPIQFLQELFNKTPKLTISQKIRRETWRVDISRFNNLRHLELIRIPMHLVEGIQSLRCQLQVIICERCTDCLEEILGTPDQIWNELHTAKLCYNQFALICLFKNTPLLRYLDLSYNKIKDKIGISLQTLKNLTYLNLSFNYLTNVPMLSEEVCHKLKVLVISNNYVQDLAAISVYDSLEVLDVSNNILADHSAISPILFLPKLRNINLRNNPISYHPHHRFHTCSYLNKGVIPDEFLLDGNKLSNSEKKEIGRRGETITHLGIALPRDLTCLPSSSRGRSESRAAPKKKVRDVVIEEGTSNLKPKISVKPPDSNQDHLEAKRQVEKLRERFGGDHWLHSDAGGIVQDLLGLERTTGPNFLVSDSLNGDEPIKPSSPNVMCPVVKVEPAPSKSGSISSEEHSEATTASHGRQGSDSTDLMFPISGVSSDTSTPSPQKVQKTPPVKLLTKKKYQENKELVVKSDGQLWLVRKHTGGSGFKELFLTLNEKEIHEKCTTTGRTITKWSMEAVLSCENINNDPPTIHMTFNTIRKACQERTFIMEFSDAQELLKKVRSFLETRSLSAMNQVAYRCMKCSSMFSVEIQPTVLPAFLTFETLPDNGKKVTICPTCGSSWVVEMDEAPLPSAVNYNVSAPPVASTSVLATTLKHSPSDCSIGSAASLEQRVDSEPQAGGAKGETPTPRRYDSDIEVISNPSLSSIEVLEVQARLHGTSTPNRKRSNEERSTVAVPQLNTVPEVQTNMAGLTESSSSGSLTDSVCTAYESNPVSMRRVGMSDLPEETSPTPTTTYTSLLEGLLQSVTAKLTPKNSPPVDSLDNSKVPYSYTDFSKVDHRVKFYLFQNTYKDDNEELVFLLRGHVVTQMGVAVSGCLVVSTHSVYILHVISPEIGDNASNWFQSKASHPRTEMSTVFALPWQLGVGFCLGSAVYLILLNSADYTSNFFKFINNILSDGKLQDIKIQDEPDTKPEKLMECLVTSVADSSGWVDSTVRHMALCNSVTVCKNNERVLELAVSPLLITTTDFLLLQPNFSWLLPSAESLPLSLAEQKMTNVVDISLNGLQLKLFYLNETENQEEVWTLELSCMEAVNSIVANIQGPWEELFSVPLTIGDKY